MKTDDLVSLLARSAQPVDSRAADRRFIGRLALAFVAAWPLMALVLGPRPDMAQAMELPMFWVKLAVPACLAAVALVLLGRVGHPGTKIGRLPVALALPLLPLWAAAIAVLAQATAPQRAALVLGESWWRCPIAITLLAIPALWIGLKALQGLAPTRLRASGAAAGLFAGASAAFAYALHCTEMELPFLAVWYVLGMAIPTAAGAWLGGRFLRW